jgi:hypothetical protein
MQPMFRRAPKSAGVMSRSAALARLVTGGFMVRWMIRRRLSVFERRYGYDVSYLREILATDLGAFLRLAGAGGIGNYRKAVPLATYYATKVTGAMTADCGPCTQLVVGMALHDGVPAPVLASIIAGNDAAMSDEARLGVRFARAVLARDPEADTWRDEVLRRWGPRAVASLGFALVASQQYPTLKYALGYGKACTRVVVAGEVVSVDRAHPDPGVVAAAGERADHHGR